MIAEKLSTALGVSVSILSKTPLSGGDINAVFKLHTDQGDFCLKQNNRLRYPEMLEKEAKGLNELRQNSSFNVPKVITGFTDETSQFLILKYIETGSKPTYFWEDFGTKLAQMHRQTNELFGWNDDNYIGSLSQSNTEYSDWYNFYAEERILPQLRMAFNAKKVDHSFVLAAEKLCRKLDTLFPRESPALLHGDLWSGNFMVNSDGNPVLIDPAVYYGHREMDLGMMHLFGGFSDTLFEAYHEEFPLELNWKELLPLTQLYPLLVHINLFGGSYTQNAESVIQQYL